MGDRAGQRCLSPRRAPAQTPAYVRAAYIDWGNPGAQAIRCALPQAIEKFTFAPGSMGPKIEAVCAFVRKTWGLATIGALEDAAALLHGETGTIITAHVRPARIDIPERSQAACLSRG